MIARRAIRRTRGGRYQLKLPAAERELLRSLPGQIRPLIEGRDRSARRLFPPAYDQEPELEADYQQLMGDDLLQRHLGSLALLEATAGRDSLDEREALGWLGALNDLRLVMGTQLDVKEDDPPVAIDDPQAPERALYYYLSWLETELVEALGDPT